MPLISEAFRRLVNTTDRVYPQADRVAALLPKILWVELTSKCPFDCVFCSRRLLRGDGEHMDFEMYKSLLRELDRPEVIRLNYSGESAHYPYLPEAIELAKRTGAITELVSAFSSISAATLEGMLSSGLDRLTVSLHSMDPEGFQSIYRFGSLEAMRNKLHQFLELRRAMNSRTVLDFAFVAMENNLGQLPEVAAYAERIGVSEVSIHPVIRRDPIAQDFPGELEGRRLTEGFKARLRRMVRDVGQKDPAVCLVVANPDAESRHCLGDVPRYYPGILPDRARISTCDQNPWETVHVLANGDVMVCEVQDKTPMGNLKSETLRQIWSGERYREFRRHYIAGRNAHCRECPWKMAYLPGRWTASIVAAPGAGSPQLLRGWHAGEGDGTIWSKGESLLALRSARRARRLRISGILPHAFDGKPNGLRLVTDGSVLGTVENSSGAFLPFDASLEIDQPAGRVLYLSLETRAVFCPLQQGAGKDARVLGFALSGVELL